MMNIINYICWVSDPFGGSGALPALIGQVPSQTLAYRFLRVG